MKRTWRSCAVLLMLLGYGLGSAQEGSLGPGDETLTSGEYFDRHPYEASAGEQLAITLESAEFDPYLGILDPQGAMVFEEDDSAGQGLNVKVTYTFPSSGLYTLIVTSAYPGETGRYILTLGDKASASLAKPRLPSEPLQDQPVQGEPVQNEPVQNQPVQNQPVQNQPVESDPLPGEPAPSPDPSPASPGPVTPPPAAAQELPAGTVPTHHFFLGTGAEVHNTTSPQIEVDSAGTLHMVYPAYAVGGAFYATCPADCSGQEQVRVVSFETDGTVYNAMLALDAGGRPHVLLSAFDKIYYATCNGDCSQQSAWTQSVALEHDNDREVTGEAFALDPQGRPRFVMHAYRAMMGIGQPDPITLYVTCDMDCQSASSWSAHKISEQIWQESTLLFNAQGQPRLATIASVDGVGDIAGYIECNADCTNEDSWLALGLENAFSDRWVEEIDPAISMVLTRAGDPRLLILGQDEAGNRRLTYSFCTAPCAGDDNGGRWSNYYLNTSDAIGAGLDLALDSQDRPRFVYTASYNILLAYCDEACDTLEGAWDLARVEMSGDIPTDTIFPYWNCSVAAWFLRRPSLAIGLDGWPRVGYEAMDISGPYGVPDPNHPECKTGADMVLTRFAQIGAYLK